jgi:hypothetical protein
MTRAWGIAGTALAVVLAAAITNPITDYKVISIIQASVRDFVRELLYPFVGTTMMIGSLLLLRMVLNPVGESWSFVLLTISGIIIYSIVVVVFDRFLGYEIFDTIQGVLQ